MRAWLRKHSTTCCATCWTPPADFTARKMPIAKGQRGSFTSGAPTKSATILGAEVGKRFCRVYDVTPDGNFDGQNILHLPKTLDQCAAMLQCAPRQLDAEMAEARAKLLQVRSQRVRPGKDDKILVSWNALMIQALARGAGVLDRPHYLAAAERAARFLLTSLRRPDGRLLHCWRQGHAKLDAYLDDYAYLINALVTLYETDFAEAWMDEAIRLTEIVLQHFPDPAAGGFYYTADDQESLIARTKEVFDSSVPGSNAMMATALIRLGKLTGRQDWLDAARGTLQSALPVMRTAPEAVAQMLVAADLWLGPTWEIVIAGDLSAPATQRVLTALRQTFIPRRVIACRGTTPGTPRSLCARPAVCGQGRSCRRTDGVCLRGIHLPGTRAGSRPHPGPVAIAGRRAAAQAVPRRRQDQAPEACDRLTAQPAAGADKRH